MDWKKIGKKLLFPTVWRMLILTAISAILLTTVFVKGLAQQDQNLMIILTGAGISVTVVTLSVILIVRATKEIRREKYGK